MNNIMYIQSQLLCIVFLGVLMWFNARHRAPKTIVNIYAVSIVASIADILMLLSAGTVAAHIFIIAYIGCIGVVGNLWLNYCLVRFEMQNKINIALCALPAVAVVGLFAISVKTGIVYYFGEQGAVVHQPLYLIAFSLLLYAVIPMAAAFVKALSEPTRTKKMEYIKVSLCAIPAIIGAVAGIFIPHGINTVVPGICLSMLILYISFQYKKILFDNLTGIQNRYGLDEEIEEQLRQYRNDKNDSFYIISCDLDDFKTINDKWGHPEGDRALKLISAVLVKVCEKYSSTAFRVGGDEFIIITDTSEIGLAEQICNELKAEFDSIDFRDDFDISMSMGAVLYDGTTLAAELISRADKVLYTAKRNK